MLLVISVLLFASSAFAAPSVAVSQYSINEIARPRDSGALMSSYVTESTLELIDGGDTNIYILTIQQILNDLANQPDPTSQAIAVAQTMAVVGTLASGLPGDSCEAAAVVNDYAAGQDSGASRVWLARLASNVDDLVQLARNPNGLRYAAGPRGKCVGGGRTYQFEAAWDGILSQCTPYTIALMNEEYCAAKRLYQAFNVRSNNVGASVTASAVPCVVEQVKKAVPACANFLKALAAGKECSGYAAACKHALLA